MKNVRKAGAAVEGAEASGKEAAGGRTAKGAAKTSSGRRSAASLLARLGLHGPDDLVLHLPLRYEDETRLVPIGSLVHGSSAQIQATVTRAEVTRGRRALQVWVNDGTGELQLRFLHFYPSQLTQLQPGRLVRAYGELRVGLFGREMVHPRYRMVSEDTPLPDRLTPVYPTVAGLGQATLRREIDRALADCRWQDTLPPTLLTALMSDSGAGKPASERPGADPVASLLAGLPPLLESLRLIHHPPPGTDLDALLERRTPACQRIVLEELVAQQLSLRRARQLRAGQRGQPLANRDGEAALLASLPFALTGAQRRVCDEIAADLARQQPMNRLLQGDVGSGKTIVAALSALAAIEAGAQVAVMAPTEILAEQHHIKFRQWLEPLGISVAWLSGSLKKKEKDQAKAALADGRIRLAVGTHALFQDDVSFQNLGLVIVDEQHRFGVAQRLALKNKGRDVHQLMMSATPIPRTLAMSFFADLDVSVIDELPPGRTPIKTRLVNNIRRREVEGFVLATCKKGQQAYWVCPLIEESEALQLQTATDTLAELQAALPDLTVGLVHGRMKSAEKAAVMAEFAAGRIHVLVATTVIEVGVDVPNAALMVIEHAERMGLSQLHQLRGRVGRGAAVSSCVLLFAEPLGDTAKARLKVIYENTDGFEIARQDLNIRGPGEFLGARQSGLPLLRFADLEQDLPLLEAARRIAPELISRHPDIVEKHLERWLASREGYLGV